MCLALRAPIGINSRAADGVNWLAKNGQVRRRKCDCVRTRSNFCIPKDVLDSSCPGACFPATEQAGCALGVGDICQGARDGRNVHVT